MKFEYRKAELSDSKRIAELFIEMLRTIYNTKQSGLRDNMESLLWTRDEVLIIVR